MAEEKRRIALTAVVVPGEGFAIGIVEENQPGFVRDKREPLFDTWEAATKRAAEMNGKLNLTQAEAFVIVGTSMHKALEEPGGKWKARG